MSLLPSAATGFERLLGSWPFALCFRSHSKLISDVVAGFDHRHPECAGRARHRNRHFQRRGTDDFNLVLVHALNGHRMCLVTVVPETVSGAQPSNCTAGGAGADLGSLDEAIFDERILVHVQVILHDRVHRVGIALECADWNDTWTAGLAAAGS